MYVDVGTEIEKFNRQIDAEVDTLLDVEVPLFVKKLAFELLVQIVKPTPVDTGRAKGNWRVVIGEAPPYDDGIKRLDGNGSSVISEEGNKVLAANFNALDVPEIWIFNNLPYIVRLENGHSQRQAPQGWVAQAFVNMQGFNA
jgi:hypothetical protein